MKIPIIKISAILSGFEPKIIINAKKATVKAARLLAKEQTFFDSDVVYIGPSSFISEQLLCTPNLNLICYGETDGLTDHIDNRSLNLIVLNKDIDSVHLYNLVNDLFAEQLKLYDDLKEVIDTFLKGYSLQQIINMSFKILKNPIALSDASYKLLAYTKDVSTDDLGWNEMVDKGRIPENRLKYFKDHRIIERMYVNRLPFITENPAVMNRCILEKVLIDNNVVAHLAVVECFKPFEERDLEVVELLCKLLSAEMQKNRLYRSAKRVIYEHFVTELLDGKISKSEVIKERESNVDLDLKDNLFVLTVNFEDYDVETTTIAYARDQLESIVNWSKSVLYDDHIILIFDCNVTIPFSQSKIKELNAFLKKYKMYSGLSRCFQDIAELRKHYHQSVSALKLGHKLNKGKQIYIYDDYAVFDFIDRHPLGDDVKDFCHPAIFKLINYDRQNASSLTQSLYVYLNNSQNIVGSAQELKIHRNTMHYRIDKAQEILQLSLEDRDISYLLHFSLKILRYLNNYSIL